MAARYISRSEVLCRSPPHPPGPVPVEVSLNGADFSFSAVQFNYHTPVAVTDLSPVTGPCYRGGTLVTVRGRGFLNRVGVFCRFGAVLSAAAVIDSTTLKCRAPPANPGMVRFGVSVNGQEFDNGRLYFLYQPDVSVSRVTPNRGLVSGQMPVFISGTNFVNSTALSARFGLTVVRATFISPRLVVALSPSRSAAMLNISGPQYVDVSNNGRDFSSSSQTFDYLEKCPVGRYCPQLDIMPCPNGTFSPTPDSHNFTLCPPGQFQPRTSQPACLPCPIGFICPAFGMARPQVGWGRAGGREGVTYCCTPRSSSP